MPIKKADYLKKVSVEIFIKMGVSKETANIVSENIIENCLFGHDSHGMVLIPRFVKDIEIGKINLDAKSEIKRKSTCAAYIDGQRGFGQVTMIDAITTATKIAKEAGISAVTVTNCNHVGILWTFAKKAVDAGVICMIWCASGPQGGHVAPFGGIKNAVGTDPIAVGIPAGQMSPLILDIATSAVSGGKIALYARQNKKIPLGWMLDQNGNPTDNPNEMVKNGKITGILLPMAGYKGFGLAMVVEVLGGILTGYGPAYTPDYKEGNGVFIIAIDIEKFLPLQDFLRDTDALFKYIKSVPTNPEIEEILIPGEIEYRSKLEREKNGIPLTDKEWEEISNLADKLGIRL